MTTTDQKVTEAADRVRAAVAAFNAATEDATRLGLRVETDQITLQTMMGDAPLLLVRVFEPR